MFYNISIGNKCFRCNQDPLKLNDCDLEDWLEYRLEIIEKHECPFKSHDRQGYEWKCDCCYICMGECERWFKPHKSNELRKDIKAAYGVWL